jgi:hypothetical protein
MTLKLLRVYAGVMGIVLTLLSIGGLMSMWIVEVGRLPLLLGTAAIYFYASFGRLGAKETCVVIGALGILYVLSGGLPFALSILEGAPLTGHEVNIILTRVVLGASSILVWFFFRNKLS